ncbi:cyclic nucleotide-binding domain-containing protein [Metabacillus hrfriensis]|uniref:Cyclic nucleotide-binding domain-containing protein n=1 Tax=Metabacillus hrfriensis TaxID=3048891 RepID=A0ACD4R5I0_9BACI|nr:cyclic nucleotide-binding domain-containing protein [Metabacillus sp. CT-WN-B3]WHZ55707.1 cyclic nucleotide-binding domain-containing protein [Metabacillus sp. CT-WN-B3]
MKKLQNQKLFEEYIAVNKIAGYFSEDMKAWMELYVFSKNEYLCREGAEMDYLYFFVDGRAKVYTTLSNGKSLLLSFYEGFKVLGDVELFQVRGAASSVQAIDDTYCIGIYLPQVREKLLRDPVFLTFMGYSLSDKLNRLSKNSSINLYYPLEHRLSSYILATGVKKESILFKENLTYLSEMLGTSYRHLLRTLDMLCKRGTIRKRENAYEVMNESELRKLAGDIYR